MPPTSVKWRIELRGNIKIKRSLNQEVKVCKLDRNQTIYTLVKMARWMGLISLLCALSTHPRNSSAQYPEYIGCYNIEGNYQDEINNPLECITKCLSQTQSNYQYAGISNYYQSVYYCYCEEKLPSNQDSRCASCNNNQYMCGTHADTKAVYRLACSPGMWGRKPTTYHPKGDSLTCGHMCGHCSTGTCDDVTGECPDNQCQAGYQPPLCDHGIQDAHYIGCYIDDEGRAFNAYGNDKWNGLESKEKVIEKCINTCIKLNLQYAGVVNGKRCFCGSSYNQYGKGGNCTVPCEGNSSQICGGEYRASVYKAECPLGFWGSNNTVCSNTCGHCENGDQCDMHSGDCNGNCAPGWKRQQKCDEMCESGSFGEGCNGKCNCYNNETCYHVTGTCPGGRCAPGYQKPNCSEVCEMDHFGVNCEKQCHCASPMDCNPINGSCSGICQDGWEGGDCQQKLISPGLTVPIVAGAAAAVVMLIIVFVIVLVVLLLRRKNAKRQSKEGIDNVSKDITEVPAVAVVANPQPQMVKKALEEKSGPSIYSVESESVIGTDDDDGQRQDMTYMNNEEVLRMTTVNLKDLETIVNREKVQQEPFKDEYERLPKGKQAEWQAAVRKGLKDKNRFKNIYPYDHHTVKLTLEDGDPLSDYVNGSFVKDSNGENIVIASQGPTPQSLPDFWRMIWEHDVNIIVMLTNLVEGGKIKCEQYWPDLGQITIGLFDIELTQSVVLPDFVIRYITVKKGAISRKVTQLHYTSWPDHGVPRIATALLNFRRKVMAEEKKFQNTGLTLIHCSAGIGRTGAYLAIDHLLREAEEKEEVNVFNCVSNLRTYRVNMVQTRAQYTFVYTALLEGIWIGETLIPCFQFHDAYSSMLNPDPYSSSTKLEQQYQLLESLKANPDSSKYSVALSEKNRSKNRNPAIVPANAGYPILMTRIKGRTEYINGVFVDGRGQRNRFLVTQMPLVDTVVDFWRMVHDYKCPAIVMLNKMEDKNQDVGIYWPVSDSPVEHGPFTMSLISENQEDGFLVTEINIQHKETSRSIKQFYFADWPLDDSIGPSSPESLFKMYEHIKMSRSSKDLDGPLVVHCLDGAELSGMYVAISNLCDMMNVEQELDVFQVVQTIRENRPQFITSQEQYRYLYEACGKYMDSFSTYANFQ